MVRSPISEKGVAPSLPGVGYGDAIGHHGEFLQGVFKTPEGRLIRGLVTVPHPRLKTTVNFWPRRSTDIRTRPDHRDKAATASQLTLAFLGHADIGGDVTIQSNIRVSSGLGSSTADVVATIRATADAFGQQLSRLDICELAVRSEHASDAIVFDLQPVLFAHRRSQLIETFRGDYPDLLIVGFDTGDDPVNTTEFQPARYSSDEIEFFEVLRGLMARSITKRDADLFCRVSTESAQINQKYLPRVRLDEITWLQDECNAKGLQVAHSGNVAGLLFGANEMAPAMVAARSLRHAGFGNVNAFRFPGGHEVPSNG